MSEAIVIREYGGAEVMKPEPVQLTLPGPGEIALRQTAVGVNFHDVYVRSGLYKTLSLPGTPGCEATGIVEGVGDGVEHLAVGDRVAYVTKDYGAYASHRMLAAALAIPLPEGVSDNAVASNLLRIMTVDMLVHQVTALRAEQTVLVQAAAGGVGRLLCQWAAHIGARVIGTVGSVEKAAQATAAGCEQVVLYREADVGEAVLDITDGRGVDLVFDSVGADTFADSLEVLAPCGHLVNFGQSSGPVEPLTMTTLAAKSLTVSRPMLFHYIADPTQYQGSGQTALRALADGVLSTPDPITFALNKAPDAHSLLESGQGGGAIVLLPQ
ncbi:MAG: quinone oxidoreductase [Pseudomonadota bacterium]